MARVESQIPPTISQGRLEETGNLRRVMEEQGACEDVENSRHLVPDGTPVAFGRTRRAPGTARLDKMVAPPFGMA
jgi:hypothetical protein